MRSESDVLPGHLGRRWGSKFTCSSYGPKVEPVFCGPERQFPEQKGQCCPLWETGVVESWVPVSLRSAWGASPPLTCAATVSVHASVSCEKAAVPGLQSPPDQSITGACLAAALWCSSPLLCFSSLSSPSAASPPALLQSRNADVIPTRLPRK